MSTSNPFRIPVKNHLVAKGLELLLGLKPLAHHYDLRPQNLDAPAFLIKLHTRRAGFRKLHHK